MNGTRSLMLLAFIVGASGCHVLGLAPVPCEDDTHCPPAARCAAGTCRATTTVDGGAVVDGGGPVDDGGRPAPPADCREILARDATASTGVHRIHPPARPDGVDVWCEMELAGGGWLLAARSTFGYDEDTDWGWDAEVGAPDDVDAPYASGVRSFGLSATELLVAEYRGDDTELDRNIYRMVLESDVLAFPARGQAVSRIDLEVVETTCEGELDLDQGQPWMLSFAGCTDRDDVFFLRDNPGCENFGLYPDGFGIAYNNCIQAGGMGNEPRGAIFVR